MTSLLFTKKVNKLQRVIGSFLDFGFYLQCFSTPIKLEPGNGPDFKNAFRILCITLPTLFFPPKHGKAWLQAIEPAANTAPFFGVVKNIMSPRT